MQRDCEDRVIEAITARREIPRLICTEALARHQAQNHTQSSQYRDEVDHSRTARMRWQISSHEYLVSSSECDEEENTLSQHEPQSEARRQEYHALGSAQRQNNLPTIQHPHRNQVQKIQPGAGARQRSPQHVGRVARTLANEN